jgi:hypothetical protein
MTSSKRSFARFTMRSHFFGSAKHILCSLVVAPCLTACNSGQPAPNGYNCGTLSSGHCYAITDFFDGKPKAYPADQSSEIFGYRTSISVTNQMARGDGFIDDEMWLLAFNGPGWIEAGYMYDFFGQGYFWAENDENTGIFVSHSVGPVSPGRDDYVLVEILNNGSNKKTSDQFLVVLVASNAAGTTTMAWDSGAVTNAMWSAGSDQFALVNFGQELAGSQGALAGLAVFVNNSWMDSNGIWRLQTADTTVDIASPPYGGWIQTPSSSLQSSQPNGGTFFTECCLPP